LSTSIDDEGFLLDKDGTRIEVTCLDCDGEGCLTCGFTGKLWATEDDL
jgi:hypothetical protein